jgi:subtilisin family serine protease
MKRILLAASIIGLLIGCSEPYTNQESAPVPGNMRSARQGVAPIPGHYVVVLKEDAALSGLGAQMKGKALGLLKKNGADEESLGFVYASAIQGFSAKLNPAQLRALSEDASVAYIEEDFVVTIEQKGNKGKPGGGGGTPTQPAQTTPWGIFQVGGAGDGTGKTAWIIDTGIDLDHPDLNVDVARGFTAFTGSTDNTPDDGNGHGTHVAGTVAALNNSIGVVGVAAGARVVPVKVLSSSGSGSNSGVIAGVDYVKAKAAVGDAANMSLGGGVSTALDNAVISAAAAGIKFALAAGNSSADANTSSPARANHANIYTVSAHNSSDVFASFSNFGNPPIDFCAPGVSIPSTWKGGGYNTISGTSMAAPHVCGILLLGTVKSRGQVSGDRDTTPDQLASR